MNETALQWPLLLLAVSGTRLLAQRRAKLGGTEARTGFKKRTALAINGIIAPFVYRTPGFRQARSQLVAPNALIQSRNAKSNAVPWQVTKASKGGV